MDKKIDPRGDTSESQVKVPKKFSMTFTLSFRQNKVLHKPVQGLFWWELKTGGTYQSSNSCLHSAPSAKHEIRSSISKFLEFGSVKTFRRAWRSWLSLSALVECFYSSCLLPEVDAGKIHHSLPVYWHGRNCLNHPCVETQKKLGIKSSVIYVLP